MNSKVAKLTQIALGNNLFFILQLNTFFVAKALIKIFLISENKGTNVLSSDLEEYELKTVTSALKNFFRYSKIST